MATRLRHRPSAGTRAPSNRPAAMQTLSAANSCSLASSHGSRELATTPEQRSLDWAA